MRSARDSCLRGVGKSQGEGAALSSSWKRALDVDLVMAGSSSNSEERLRWKSLVDMTGLSSVGELPNNDMASEKGGAGDAMRGQSVSTKRIGGEGGEASRLMRFESFRTRLLARKDGFAGVPATNNELIGPSRVWLCGLLSTSGGSKDFPRAGCVVIDS